jgi:hypothetical protein
MADTVSIGRTHPCVRVFGWVGLRWACERNEPGHWEREQFGREHPNYVLLGTGTPDRGRRGRCQRPDTLRPARYVPGDCGRRVGVLCSDWEQRHGHEQHPYEHLRRFARRVLARANPTLKPVPARFRMRRSISTRLLPVLASRDSRLWSMASFRYRSLARLRLGNFLLLFPKEANQCAASTARRCRLVQA